MKPFAIAMHFNIFEHLALGIGTDPEAFAMDGFDPELCHGCVIITVAFPAHAANQPMFSEKLLVNGWTILAAPVRMGCHAPWHLPVPLVPRVGITP